MILAQNLHRQSNGSSFLILFFLVSLLASCSTTKTTITPKAEVPKEVVVTETPTGNPTIIDTIVWKEIDETIEAPIINETASAPNLDKRDSYQLTIFLPLEATELLEGGIENPYINDDKFVNFYAGAMMAINQLETQGTSFKISVYDSEAEGGVTNLLLSSDVRSSDLIIAPRNTEQLKEVASFGGEREITVISPWKSLSKGPEDNPYYLQLIPGLYDHFDRIAAHVNENFKPENVILLGRNDKDQNRFKHFQKDTFFQELIIDEDSLIQADFVFDSLLFNPMEPSAVIIPNYLSRDEDFVYNSLRRINIERVGRDVVVYGMPMMMDSDRTSYNLYNSLQMRVCMSKYADHLDESIVEFERRYFDAYSALPTSDAFEGYDVMMFIGKNLMEYGRNFQFHLEEQKEDYLQTSYKLEKVLKTVDGDPDDFDNVRYYVNKHLDIIEFRDNTFKRSPN